MTQTFIQTWKLKGLLLVSRLHVSAQTKLEPERLGTSGASLELATPDHDGDRSVDDIDNFTVVLSF